MHQRLRRTLLEVRAAAHRGERTTAVAADLLLFCHGFCTALTEHHQAEDRELFPAVAGAYPALRPALRRLAEDHAMIAALIVEVRAAGDGTGPADELGRYLDGIAAIMESHFRYEERELLGVLDALGTRTDARPQPDPDRLSADTARSAT